MEASIFNCNCKHPNQDERYGPGRRVFNPLKKAKLETQKWRCTVCSSVIERGAAPALAAAAAADSAKSRQ